MTKVDMPEPDDDIDVERLKRLAHELCEGIITDDGITELSALLESSQRAVEEYWQIVAIDSELRWDLAKDVGRIGAATLSYDSAVEAKSRLAAPLRSTWSPRSRYILVAACLLLSAFGGGAAWWLVGGRHNILATLHIADSNPAEAEALGTLTAIVPESNWSVGRPGRNNVAALQQGDTLYLDAGAAELRLVTNTVAILESPLVMQVVSVDRIRVIRGNIKVEVAKGAEGFSVETTSAEVIDLGTEFAVNVNDGNTDVVVYDGEVDLKVAAADDSRDAERVTKRFRAGEAVHVTDDGTLSRIVDVRRTKFDRGRESQRPHVIAEVKDNNVRDNFWSFYEIVPAGMDEDAKSFVDRPFHEWNGYLSTGMPAYLLGGDYVKTFNDDKVTDDLVIDVKLERPATLYVLLDQRLLPPQWLVGSFEPTDDIIGLDEAPYVPDNPSHTYRSGTEVGPGKSINRIFKIWKRVAPNGGVVSLGPNGRRADDPQTEPLAKIEANMYGIVAVALPQ